MSAPEKSSLNSDNVPRLGVIAGGGDIPAKLLAACDDAGRDVFLVGFEGQTDTALTEGRAYMMTRIGAAGQIISTLKSHNIKDLVLIGSVRRPSLAELKPDMRTAQFFAKIGLKALGDDGLLKALRHELENEGFIIHGVHKFMQDLIAVPGSLGTHKPKKEDWPDIRRGVKASQLLGQLDIGQAAVVQQGIVLGVEGVEGTDELIARCGGLQRKGRGPILIKTCKPQQDHDFDMPTIGPQTARICAARGYAGIVIEAGRSLVVSADELAVEANKHKIFVMAVTEQDMTDAAGQ